MSVLDKGDYVHSTHRNHGHLLARGADPKKALAEILGKATGYAGGKAGTLHGCAPDLNFPLSSGIVAGILPISTGTAYAMKHRGQPNVSAVFFGEGAMEEGAAYEALNLAALWKLPVLFVCENNTAEVERKPGGGQYHAPNLSIFELTDLAKSMGLATAIVDGSDLGAVWNAAKAARARAVKRRRRHLHGGSHRDLARRAMADAGHRPHRHPARLDPRGPGEIRASRRMVRAQRPGAGASPARCSPSAWSAKQDLEQDRCGGPERDRIRPSSSPTRAPSPTRRAALTHVWPQ